MKKIIKPLSLLLAATMIATSCGNSGADTTGSTGGTTEGSTEGATGEGASKYEEFITVDVFNTFANYQGMQSGWFAKIVKDKFNMELNIIAPQVAGGGDTLYQTRVAAGDLGDLILTNADNGKMNELAKYGLLYDMSSDLETRENLKKYQIGIDSLNSLVEVDGVYGIPMEVSTKNANEPIEVLEPTFGPYVRWDLYKELGYPELNSMNDLIDVLADMQALEPTSESGKKVYAISLFGDWDGDSMTYANQMPAMYGFGNMGFAWASADGTQYSDMLDENGKYLESLEFLFNANQKGLVDPESTTQNYDMLFSKYQDGAVLYAPWPWLGQAGYNTLERKEAGKAMMFLPVKDLDIVAYGARPEGTNFYYAVGSKAEDPERLVDFIDWLYSPEGVNCVSSSGLGGTAGPEGLTWEMKDGEPVLTEFGKQAFFGTNAEVPAEWGGGIYQDGAAALYSTVQSSDINPETGYAYTFQGWPSVIELNATPVDKDWQEVMGAMSTMDYITNNDMISIANGTGYIAPQASSEISTLKGQIGSLVTEYSWKMVFAKDKAEFDNLFAELQKTCYGLGYETVLEFDMQNAKDQDAARKAAVK